jgi:dienelactone hydrolase
MATPTLTKTTLAGAIGEILIDVRSGNRAHPGPATLILHGFKGFKDWGMFPPLAERLARAGFTAVSFNLSGSGVDDQGRFSRPERFGHNSFSAERADVDAVMAALERGELGIPKPTSVGIIGHSRGGGIAILVAEQSRRIAALATWAAIAHVRRWSADQRRLWREQGKLEIVNARTGEVLPMYLETLDDLEANGSGSLDIEAAAARLTTPWLLVHGEADEAVPITEARQLLGAARRARVESLLLPETGHTFGAVHPFAGTTPSLERAIEATVAFFSRELA